MNAKDYRTFAKMLNQLTNKSVFDFMIDYSVAREKVLEEVMHKMCEVFAEDNPKFDKQRFIDACNEQS